MEDRSPDRRFRVRGVRLSRRNALAGLSGLAAIGLHGAVGAQSNPVGDETSLSLPCEPCAGADNADACCLPGLTGGGVVQLDARQAQIVVFAMRLDGNPVQEGAGFVRWIDERWQETELVLESVGPISYKPVEGEEQARDIRGVMRANGEGEFAFQLRLVDFGPGRESEDTASLAVANLASGFARGQALGYQVQGRLVGGDFQLLNAVAPIATH